MARSLLELIKSSLFSCWRNSSRERAEMTEDFYQVPAEVVERLKDFLVAVSHRTASEEISLEASLLWETLKELTNG